MTSLLRDRGPRRLVTTTSSSIDDEVPRARPPGFRARKVRYRIKTTPPTVPSTIPATVPGGGLESIRPYVEGMETVV